jgi:GH25 family lysozyme M1 (1,4-beta-N-acetylmuramidase)
MLRMIDESAYQSSYWTAAALRINGVKVVAIKVTEGVGWFSNYYTWQLQQARLAGCAVVHCHLAHPEANSAADEAAYFFSKVKAEPGDLVALEAVAAIYRLIPPVAASSWTAQFSGDVKEHFGVLPVVFSAGSTIGDGALESVRDRNPLWFASPGANPDSPPAPPRPWLVSFLQYTVNHRWAPPNGTDVDVAYFAGFKQLAKLAIPPAVINVKVTVQDKSTTFRSSKHVSFPVSWI